METQSYAGLAHTLQTVAIATLIFAVCAFIPKLDYRLKLAKLPLFGASSSGEKQRQIFIKSARDIYNDGYKKFKNSVYRVASSDDEDTIVVPLSMLPELRKLPDDVLSFPRAVEKSMESRYTRVDTDAPILIHSIRTDLTPALGRMTATIREEVDTAMEQYLPSCEDWTEVTIYKALVDIIAQVSGRIFVGPELCKDATYLECSINYTMDLVNSVTAIKALRPWLRPFLASRLPEIQQLRKRERTAAEYLKPIIKQRQDAEKNDPEWQKPDDMMQWLITRSTSDGTPLDVNTLAKNQLTLTFAAIHTTTMTTTNILYTLATTPEYIGPLREEIQRVLSENDGQLSTRALQQMEKLDSYMKEVNRVYTPGLTTFSRRVLKGITLSNGQYLPPGVLIETPSDAMYKDSEIYPDSDKFDGFRHYNLRRNGSATDHARNQFVTTNEMNLAFGYGRHACPGRFFAANEMKLIIARLILGYDIKMPEGLTKRYEQIEIGKSTMPHPARPLLLKKVQC